MCCWSPMKNCTLDTAHKLTYSPLFRSDMWALSFLWQVETLSHTYIRCDHLTPLFMVLKALFACLSLGFSFPIFIFGPSGPFCLPKVVLPNFLISQAKLAIYMTRKSKLNNNLYSMGTVVIFKVLSESRIKLDFYCCSHSSQLDHFEKLRCMYDDFCKVSEGCLILTF